MEDPERAMYTNTDDKLNEENAKPLVGPFPTELWLQVIRYLNVMDREDLETLKNLSLTNRQMLATTFDKKTIDQMLKQRAPHYQKLFSDTAWTPKLLSRLLSLDNDISVCADRIFVAGTSVQAPIAHQAILLKGMRKIAQLVGLEDNATQYHLFTRCTREDIVCMFVSALMFQRTFWIVHDKKLAGIGSLVMFRIVEQAVKCVFLNRTPSAALRLLESPAGTTDHEGMIYRYHGVRWFSLKWIRTAGRKCLDIHRHKSDRTTKERGFVIKDMDLDDVRRTYSANDVPEHRIDERLRWAVGNIVRHWVATGRDANYFNHPSAGEQPIEAGFGNDLVNCLRRWEHDAFLFGHTS